MHSTIYSVVLCPHHRLRSLRQPRQVHSLAASSHRMEQPAANTPIEHPFHLLPDELWALVLSKCTWRGCWRQAKLLLCWKPGAAHALQEQPLLLAQLLTGSSDDSSEALQRAAGRGRVDVATLLLAQHTGGAANSTCALTHAVAKGHGAMVKLLLHHTHANCNDSSSMPAVLNGALITAAQTGQTAMAQLLLEAGANVNLFHNSNLGHGVLVWAAINGHHETARLLLAHGADVHARNNQAICLAAYYGHALTVEVLLDAGAAPGAVISEGFAMNCHGSVLRVLLRRGLQLDAATEKRMLRAASAAGRHSTVQLLLGRRVRTRAEATRLAALLQSQ